VNEKMHLAMSRDESNWQSDDLLDQLISIDLNKESLDQEEE